MKIPVTQDHIDKGRHGDPSGCPLALAIREATTWMPRVVVPHVRLSDADYILPQNARDFIFRYETLQGVEPFEFEMEVPG